jgi:hypothetical protein
MLPVQIYLHSGKSFADLEIEFYIKPTFHPTLPLVILNYSQIDSPKTNNIVRNCRGLVLNTTTYDIVARSFDRFFNWGEVQTEMGDFDFSDFSTKSKEDGSLVLLYRFEGKWYANTRGSFGTDPIQSNGITWQQAICQAMNIPDLQYLDRFLFSNVTYVCEFCSGLNKIVRRYPYPVLYLLTGFYGKRELDESTLFASMTIDGRALFKWPLTYNFKSIKQIEDFLKLQETDDPTFEGVVISDRLGHRWKIKSATYLSLHRLRGNADNLFNPKHLIPFILSGETSELLTYFPEVKVTLHDVHQKVNAAYSTMMGVWTVAKDIESQKDFALAIVGKTPFTGILFTARKNKVSPRDVWRNSADIILNTLFKA